MTMKIKGVLRPRANNILDTILPDRESTIQKLRNMPEKAIPKKIIKIKLKFMSSDNYEKKNQKFICLLITFELSIDDFIELANCGIDLSYQNHLPLLVSLRHSSTDIAAYLFQSTRVDINSIDLFVNTTKFCNFNEKMLDLLLINNYQIPRIHISYILTHFNNGANIDIILRHGYSIMDIFTEIANNQRYINTNTFKYLLDNFFDQIISLDQSTITSLFEKMIYAQSNRKQLISLDRVKYLASNGLNIRHNNDEFFMKFCHINNLEIIKYFVEEIGVDINRHNSLALVYAIENRYYFLTEYLLLNGAIITKDAIKSCLSSAWSEDSSVQIFDLLLQYGDHQEIAASLLDNVYSWSPALGFFSKLVDSGVDLNMIVKKLN